MNTFDSRPISGETAISFDLDIFRSLIDGDTRSEYEGRLTNGKCSSNVYIFIILNQKYRFQRSSVAGLALSTAGGIEL